MPAGDVLAISDSLGTFSLPMFVVRPELPEAETNGAGKAWLESFGLTGAAVRLDDLFVPALEGDRFDDIVATVARTGASMIAVFRFIPDEKGVPMNVLFAAQSGEGGGGVLVQILPQGTSLETDLDLLIRERTAEVTQLNSFLSAIVDSSTETFIIAVGTNDRILSFNEGARQIFLYARAEAVARMFAWQLFAPDAEPQRVWQELAASARLEGKSRMVTDLVRKDGSVFPALVDVSPLLGAQRQSLGMLLLGRNMTETLQTQRALEEKKEQLEFINQLSLRISQTLELDEISAITMETLSRKFDATVGGVYLRDEEEDTFHLHAVEPRQVRDLAVGVLEPSEEELTGLGAGTIILRDGADIEPSALGRVGTRMLLPLLPKTSLRGLIALHLRNRLDPTEETLSFLSALSSSISGAVENAILYFESLNKSREIKKQNQELDEFAYVVSHDLKEPLAGISFISNMLVDEYFDQLDETGKTYVNSLIDFSKRLGSLIDALLDLSRVGRITQPPESVSVSDVLYNVSQNLSYRISRQDIQLRVADNLPSVYGDKTRIEQVFFNLLSNAIKFNDKQKVVVEVMFSDADEHFYEFVVRDNGIGIEPEYFEKIFKIFERLHQREEYEGNGAGLTIVKKIIENHGGRIWLESQLHKGTAFYFTLPKVKGTV